MSTVSSAACAMRYYQCGGIGFSGAQCCVAGNLCVYQNDYYSQCLAESSALTSIEPPPSTTSAAAATAAAATAAAAVVVTTGSAASWAKSSTTTMAAGVAADLASDGSLLHTNSSSTLFSSIVAGSIGGAVCVIVAFGILAFRRRGMSKRSARKSTRYSLVSEFADTDDGFSVKMSVPEKAHV